MPKRGKPAQPSTTEAYLRADHLRTLFPLETTSVLVENFADVIRDQIYQRILNINEDEAQFPPQQRCYAAKHDLFLRRTFKLNPVAEFFLYDIVYRNRKSFRKDHRKKRKTFGYRFKGGRAESPSLAYGEFKSAIWKGQREYNAWVATDIATYFNSIYHHDLVTCVRDLGWTPEDVEALGRFLRQINVGRSIDCLPQGVHPAKVLGAEFLRFVDDSHLIKSQLSVRFQDDIVLFDDNKATLDADLLTLQALIGQKGLSLNTTKTMFGPDDNPLDIEDEVDEVHAELLRRRRSLVVGAYGDEEVDESDYEEPLGEKETQYLLGLIASPDVEEADVELVLALLRDHGDEVLPRMLDVLESFPGISKNLYTYVRFADYLEDLDDLILTFLQQSKHASEFQLFWLTKVATDFLSDSPRLGEILTTAYEHANATVVSQAKVLEHPDNRFGLKELRDEQLRSGRSDWLSWAAAAGTRELKPGSRNHLLGYFANGSSFNSFVAQCIKKLP